MFYFLIYKFRKSQAARIQGKQDDMVRYLVLLPSGISEDVKTKRKERNIVTTAVNFAVWLIEVTFLLMRSIFEYEHQGPASRALFAKNCN